MTERKNTSIRGFGAICSGVVPALAMLLLAGCGPDNDPVDVEPMEPSEREAPALEDSRPENAALDNKMDPMRDANIEEAERHSLAEADLMPVGESGVTGNIRFEQRGDMLQISGRITGLSPGAHGLHIHEIGDCSGPAASSAGAHFSPAGDPHGSPQVPDERHHAGDLGNITADDDGNADFEVIEIDLQLGSSSHSIIDRAVIVHADADDLVTQPAGNAGPRVGCGVIRPVLQPTYVPE